MLCTADTHTCNLVGRGKEADTLGKGASCESLGRCGFLFGFGFWKGRMAVAHSMWDPNSPTEDGTPLHWEHQSLTGQQGKSTRGVLRKRISLEGSKHAENIPVGERG